MERKKRHIIYWENLFHHSTKTLNQLHDYGIMTHTFPQHGESSNQLIRTIQDLAYYWKQQNQVQWDVCRENMTKFFFDCTCNRLTHNRTRGCMDDDRRWIIDHEELIKRTISYFQYLFHVHNPETNVTRQLQSGKCNI